mgnify:CR=1 FL=1
MSDDINEIQAAMSLDGYEALCKKYGYKVGEPISNLLNNKDCLYTEADLYRFGLEVEKEILKEFRHWGIFELFQKYRRNKQLVNEKQNENT